MQEKSKQLAGDVKHTEGYHQRMKEFSTRKKEEEKKKNKSGGGGGGGVESKN